MSDRTARRGGCAGRWEGVTLLCVLSHVHQKQLLEALWEGEGGVREDARDGEGTDGEEEEERESRRGVRPEKHANRAPSAARRLCGGLAFHTSFN